MNLKTLNIAMAGGGTGGHVFPIKSLIEYLHKHHEFHQKINHIYRFGSKNSLEQKVCHDLQSPSGLSSLSFTPILSGKYRRETPLKSRLKNVRDLFLFIVGLFQSLFRLLYYRIDVVFCKGGYVALPVVLAGFILRKKIIVHESDTHSGLVNRIAARFASKVFTGFDKVLPHSETVGQILSDELVFNGNINSLSPQPANPPPSGLSSLSLPSSPSLPQILSKIDHKKTIVLVVGGSQGSHRLYNSLLHVLKSNPDIIANMTFFVSLGVLNNDLKPEFAHFPNVFTFDFLTQQEMGAICHFADIGLTRGGTTGLAEQKLYDMKLFIVPISRTHDQYNNAKYYVHHYQDLLIDQKKPDFEEHLAQICRQHIGFKKTSTSKNILDSIGQAKNKIAKAIVG